MEVENDELPEMCGKKEERGKPVTLHRRKTWPRLVLCINDIIYWEDGYAEKIGEGFYSDVYKFCHRASGHTVVVKAAKESHVTNNQDQEVMMREIRLLKKLNHENIIRYLGLCAKDGKFHPVLEFINGGSLDCLLLDWSIDLSWEEKVGFCIDVAKGMKYLHLNHIFHRDLKSSNCLIRYGDGGIRTIIVADFGLAREVTGDTRTPRKMSTVGTTFWMAPELLNGKLYNIKIDVFSYGILACEIFARVMSDPDSVPRTSSFGLDSERFAGICPDCPESLMQLVKDCTEVINILARPGFDEILERLEDVTNACDVNEDADVTDASLTKEPHPCIDDEANNNTIACRCHFCHNGRYCKNIESTPVVGGIPQGANIGPTLLPVGVPLTRHHKRRSGLSDDSGISDCETGAPTCSCCKKLPNLPSSGSNNSASRNTLSSTKKVSFKFVAKFLTWRRQFENNESVTPSKSVTMRRSASLPDLKSPTSESASSERKLRTKSCFFDKGSS